MKRTSLTIASLCLAWLACLHAPLAQEPAAQEPAAQANSEPASILEETANGFVFSLQDDPQEFKRVARPVLTWTNPLRRTPDGAVYLWTHQGRPQVAGCIFTYGEENDNLDQEFVFLGIDPITARRKDKVVWEASAPKTSLAPLPAAPSPADTEARRLIQMRTLARDFTAAVDTKPDRHELRLLPQPIYRYPPDHKQFLDGALFALVQGTDPEVLLLLEAERGKNPTWRYSLSRMTDRLLEVEYRGRPVWTAEPWKWDRRQDEPGYTRFHENLKR